MEHSGAEQLTKSEATEDQNISANGNPEGAEALRLRRQQALDNSWQDVDAADYDPATQIQASPSAQIRQEVSPAQHSAAKTPEVLTEPAVLANQESPVVPVVEQSDRQLDPEVTERMAGYIANVNGTPAQNRERRGFFKRFGKEAVPDVRQLANELKEEQQRYWEHEQFRRDIAARIAAEPDDDRRQLLQLAAEDVLRSHKLQDSVRMDYLHMPVDATREMLEEGVRALRERNGRLRSINLEITDALRLKRELSRPTVDSAKKTGVGESEADLADKVYKLLAYRLTLQADFEKTGREMAIAQHVKTKQEEAKRLQTHFRTILLPALKAVNQQLREVDPDGQLQRQAEAKGIVPAAIAEGRAMANLESGDYDVVEPIGSAEIVPSAEALTAPAIEDERLAKLRTLVAYRQKVEKDFEETGKNLNAAMMIGQLGRKKAEPLRDKMQNDIGPALRAVSEQIASLDPDGKLLAQLGTEAISAAPAAEWRAMARPQFIAVESDEPDQSDGPVEVRFPGKKLSRPIGTDGAALMEHPFPRPAAGSQPRIPEGEAAGVVPFSLAGAQSESARRVPEADRGNPAPVAERVSRFTEQESNAVVEAEEAELAEVVALLREEEESTKQYQAALKKGIAAIEGKNIDQQPVSQEQLQMLKDKLEIVRSKIGHYPNAVTNRAGARILDEKRQAATLTLEKASGALRSAAVSRRRAA